jgi:hypothetical protein
MKRLEIKMDDQERLSMQNDPVLKAITGDPSGPIPPEWMTNANDYSLHQTHNSGRYAGTFGSWAVIIVSLGFLALGVFSW